MHQEVFDDTHIHLGVVVPRSEHTAVGQPQMEAPANVAVGVECRSRILDRAETRLVSLAGAGFANAIEERHRAVLGQSLDVSSESGLGRVARNYWFVELGLRLVQRILLFGFVDASPAPRLYRCILQIHAAAIARRSAGGVFLYFDFRNGW